jgi:CheY-like chemotaxis protein
MAALVVDDSATNRELMGSTLKRWLMVVELAASGEEGMAALLRAEESGSPFPLVFIDAEMPNMDGFELVQKIHQNPRLAAATLIMMLTPSGQLGDAARCRELRISTHLVKPVGESELFQAIQTALAKPPHKPREAPFAPPPPLPSPKPSRILLAEDNAVNRQVVIRLLEKRGHVITVATDGAQAVAMTRKSSFDMVLMDIQMPGMDGYEATAVIRKDEESTGKHLPIIAMTAHAMEGDRQKCLAAGMDDFVAKPIRVDELVKIIENHDRTPHEAAEPEANGNSGQTAIDLDLALARVGGDTDLLKEIAGLFCNQAPESMATIKRAMNAHDAVTIQRETHRLKGSIGNFASQAAFDAAQRLESLGTEGNFSEAVNAYALLEYELDRLLSALVALKDLEAGT